MRKVHILYPENRVVDESVIIGWAQDLWDHNGFEPTELEDAIEFLDSLGEVTFSKHIISD